MDKRESYFKNLIIAAGEATNIKWKELNFTLKKMGIVNYQYDKVWAGQQFDKKMNQSVPILSFLQVVKKYKEYPFKQILTKNEEIHEDISKRDATQEEKKEQQDERAENINENRVKMPCMPEIKEFEEKLAMVDKTQPVEKRIEFVLDAMGFKQLSEKNQKNIMEIATIAVKSSRMSYDIIAVKAQIQGDSLMTARMEFAKFVTNFAKKYDSSAQVKILDFLSDLQKIIMFESEIEDYSDLDEN